MLEVQNLNFSYGLLTVLWEVALKVERGELVAIVGANGAGKTTLLKVICGLCKPATGRIFADGRDITSVPAHKRVSIGLAMVPEGRQIFGGLSVVDNLELGAYSRRRGARRVEIEEDLAKVFALFPGLEERRRQTAATMSGGEQQMLAIGRALMARPKMLLLDEPSLGLAPRICVSIFDAIKALNRSGLTVLLVEQNATAALKMADRSYVLESGRVVAEGSAAEMLRDPRIASNYLGY